MIKHTVKLLIGIFLLLLGLHMGADAIGINLPFLDYLEAHLGNIFNILIPLFLIVLGIRMIFGIQEHKKS